MIIESKPLHKKKKRLAKRNSLKKEGSQNSEKVCQVSIMPWKREGLILDCYHGICVHVRISDLASYEPDTFGNQSKEDFLA